MSVIVSQITDNSIVYLDAFSNQQQGKYQSSESLAFGELNPLMTDGFP